MTDVCAVDGVRILKAATGRLVHIDELPRGTEPHDIEPTTFEAWVGASDARTDLARAASDMLLHHATLHPLAECEWAGRLRSALRAG